MAKNTDLKFPWSKISLYSSKINIKYFLLFTVILISVILRLYKGADFYQKYNFYKSKASKVIDVNEVQVLIVEER